MWNFKKFPLNPNRLREQNALEQFSASTDEVAFYALNKLYCMNKYLRVRAKLKILKFKRILQKLIFITS